MLVYPGFELPPEGLIYPQPPTALHTPDIPVPLGSIFSVGRVVDVKVP